MIYKCIKGFTVECVDGDGLDTGATICVEEDSLWQRNELSLIDGEVHLDGLEGTDDELNWIELSEDELKEYFVIEGEDYDE